MYENSLRWYRLLWYRRLMKSVQEILLSLPQPPHVNDEEFHRARMWVIDATATTSVPLPQPPPLGIEVLVNAKTYAGCHLELRLLDRDEVCGACGHAASEHRYHPSNR